MHGNAVVNRALMKADLVIAVGSKLSDRRSTGKQSGFAPNARVIHIDLDVAEIHKNIGANVWLVGDAKKILDVLAAEASGHDSSARKAWRDELRMLDAKEPLRREAPNGDVYPWQVIDSMDRVTGGEAIITTEVGQHQMWAALYHKGEAPETFITSGGLGTMGFGIPASMGAHFAKPELPIFCCIAGDGSAMMNIQELDTYARYQMPIKVLVFDNNCLGMVRQWQELFFKERFSNTIYGRCPDFVKIAQGMGIEAFRVDDPYDAGQLNRKRAINTPGPVWFIFRYHRSRRFSPWFLPGISRSDDALEKTS